MKWLVLCVVSVSFFAKTVSASQETYKERGRSDFFSNAVYIQDCTPAGCWGGGCCSGRNHWQSCCPVWGFAFEADYIRFPHLPGFDYGTFSAATPDDILPLSSFVPLADPRPWDLDHDHVSGFLPTLWLTFFVPHACYAPRVSFFGSIFARTRKEDFSTEETHFLTLPFVDGSDVFTIGTPDPAPFFLDGTLERNYKYRTAGVEFRETIPACTCNVPMYFEPFLLLQFSQFQQNYLLSFNFDFADFRLDERLHTIYGDFGGGVALDLPLCRWLTLVVEGKALASFAHASLSADQDFTGAIVDFHEHHDQAGGKFSGGGGLYFHYRCFTIGAVGKYEYWTYFPSVINPHFDEEAVRIGKDNLRFYTAGLKITMAW